MCFLSNRTNDKKGIFTDMQLFVNTPGTSIKQKDNCFRLSHKEKFFDVSPEKVESIVATNKAVISTQAIVLALENNIDIIFLDAFGDPVGRVWFSKMGSTALIRRRQRRQNLFPMSFPINA